MTVKSKFSDMADKTAANFAQWKDTLKVKAHLANKDAQDAMEELTQQLGTLAQRLERASQRASEDMATDEGRLQLHLGLMEVKERWEKLRPSFEKIVAQVKETGKSTFEGLGGDRAQLQAHLARMDAEDAIDARAEEARKWLNNVGEAAEEQLTTIVEKLKAQADEVFGRLEK